MAILKRYLLWYKLFKKRLTKLTLHFIFCLKAFGLIYDFLHTNTTLYKLVTLFHTFNYSWAWKIRKLLLSKPAEPQRSTHLIYTLITQHPLNKNQTSGIRWIVCKIKLANYINKSHRGSFHFINKAGNWENTGRERRFRNFSNGHSCNLLLGIQLLWSNSLHVTLVTGEIICTTNYKGRH